MRSQKRRRSAARVFEMQRYEDVSLREYRGKANCHRKKRFSSRKALRAAILQTQRYGDVSLTGYRCNQCGYYHVTSLVFNSDDLHELRKLISKGQKPSPNN